MCDRSWHRLLRFLGLAAMAMFATTAQAIFTNGGFENGDFSGWTRMNASNYDGLKLPLPFTIDSIQLSYVGTSTDLTSVVEAVPDPRTDNLLPLPGVGKYTAKINDESWDSHVNAITQTDTLKASDLGSDGKYHIRFSYAAVLEDPQHNPEEQPYFYVLLQDVTSNTILYSEFTYSNQPGRSFHVSNDSYGWLWTDWNNVDIALPISSLGHTITITALAADCSLGGHGGYVYLDGFGSQGNAVSGMALTALSPSSAPVGDQTFTLTVTGSGFQSGDVVQWGGLSRATTYISTTELTAVITATDISAAGSQIVTVARGSQVSSSLEFTVASSIPVVTPITAPAQVVTDPLSNVSVDATGALVVTASTAPIVLNPAAPEDALVRLKTLQPVSITSGTTTLQYTDQSGAAQLVVRTVNNQPQLEVAKGTVLISAPSPGVTISVMSSNRQTVGAVITQTSNDQVIVAKTDTSAAVFVDNGRINYQGPGPGTAIPVYQGENTLMDASGNLTQLALGSLNGQKQVPGDPLPVQIPKDSGTKIPNLEGTLPRFSNTVSLLDLVGDAIKALLGDSSGQLSYDKATGVITYALGNTTVRLVALGDVLVQINQFAATNAAATAGGAYALASRGIQLSLSGALGYFSDLQSAVQAADAAGTLNLKPTGAIEIRLGGGRYVVMPGVSATLPGIPTLIVGIESDADGLLVFRDHLGTLQTLYPAFLDVDTLSSTFKTAIPTIVLANKGDGTVSAALAGQNYTLRPEYQVVDQPLGHATDAYWLENGTIFLHNADLSAQGFKVQ
ncbi:MAG: hypothetical protein WCV99_16910 [Sterolibacterium sp.]|jgi:hypothetical protein